MPRHVLLPGTSSGTRIADQHSHETITIAGRQLDNMSASAAEEAIRLLERLNALKQEHAAGAERRNDLVAILETASQDRYRP